MSLTREQLWAHYCLKNPSFAGDGNVTMSAAGLAKLFGQTWTIAHERGFKNGQAYEQNQATMRKNAAPKDPIADLLKSFTK